MGSSLDLHTGFWACALSPRFFHIFLLVAGFSALVQGKSWASDCDVISRAVSAAKKSEFSVQEVLAAVRVVAKEVPLTTVADFEGFFDGVTRNGFSLERGLTFEAAQDIQFWKIHADRLIETSACGKVVCLSRKDFIQATGRLRGLVGMPSVATMRKGLRPSVLSRVELWERVLRDGGNAIVPGNEAQRFLGVLRANLGGGTLKTQVKAKLTGLLKVLLVSKEDQLKQGVIDEIDRLLSSGKEITFGEMNQVTKSYFYAAFKKSPYNAKVFDQVIRLPDGGIRSELRFFGSDDGDIVEFNQMSPFGFAYVQVPEIKGRTVFPFDGRPDETLESFIAHDVAHSNDILESAWAQIEQDVYPNALIRIDPAQRFEIGVREREFFYYRFRQVVAEQKDPNVRHALELCWFVGFHEGRKNFMTQGWGAGFAKMYSNPFNRQTLMSRLKRPLDLGAAPYGQLTEADFDEALRILESELGTQGLP